MYRKKGIAIYIYIYTKGEHNKFCMNPASFGGKRVPGIHCGCTNLSKKSWNQDIHLDIPLRHIINGCSFTTSDTIGMLLAIVLLLLLVSPWRNLAFPKKEQHTAVKAVYNGKDIPTGYRKSLSYSPLHDDPSHVHLL